MTFAANATDYYLIGGFNGWTLKQSECKFTEGSNGEYTLDYVGTLTSGFKINDGTWGENANFGGNTTLELGKEYILDVGGGSGNIPLSENIENPHLVFNPDAKTLLITGQAVEPEYAYAISGQILSENVGADNKPLWEDKTLTEESDGTWTITTTCYPGEFGIKMIDKSTGSQVSWFGLYDTVTLQPEFGEPIVMKEDGPNLKLVKGGECTFTFNPETWILTVTGDGEFSKKEYTYAIFGSIFGEVDKDGNPTWSGAALTENNGKWSVTSDCIPGQFGIQKINKDTEQQEEWIAWDAQATRQPSFDAIIKMNVGGTNLNLVEGGNCTFTFDPEDMELTVTGAGSFGTVKYGYGIKGNIFSTTEKPNDWIAVEMEEKDGLWVLADKETTLKGSFGIYEMDKATGAQTGWLNLADGAEFALDTPVKLTFEIGPNINNLEEGTYTFTFNPESLELTVTAPQVEENNFDYYIHGDIFPTTSDWMSEKMTLIDGKYVLADVDIEAGNFGIQVKDPAITEGNPNVGWYAGKDKSEVELGIPIDLTDTDGKNLSIVKGKYTFTFDLEAMTLTVTGNTLPDVDPEYAYVMYGAETEKGAWEDKEMTITQSGNWTVTLAKPLVEFGIKKVDTAHRNKQVAWIGSANESPAIAALGTYNAKEDGKNWTSTLTNKSIYTFNPEKMTLTVDNETGISAIEAEEGEAVYYNLQGVRIEKPVKGAYIRVVNGKAVKVMK